MLQPNDTKGIELSLGPLTYRVATSAVAAGSAVEADLVKADKWLFRDLLKPLALPRGGGERKGPCLACERLSNVTTGLRPMPLFTIERKASLCASCYWWNTKNLNKSGQQLIPIGATALQCVQYVLLRARPLILAGFWPAFATRQSSSRSIRNRDRSSGARSNQKTFSGTPARSTLKRGLRRIRPS